MGGKIDLATAPTAAGTLYPPPYDAPTLARHRTKLGDAAGLTQFGVNLCRLPPGTWTAQRHWHAVEDELVFVLEGEVVLVTEAGEEILRPGDSAGFKAGVPDGHCLQNRGDRDAVVLEIGSRREDEVVEYPDIDLKLVAGRPSYLHRDGTSYPPIPRHTA